MTKDYAKPSTTRQPRKSKPKRKAIPGWVWVFSLSVAAGFGYFLYYLTTLPPAPPVETAAKKPTKPPVVKKNQENKSEERFKFYDILEDAKVTPPKVEEYKFKEKGSSGKEFVYLLQTGSFRSSNDAERQRAMIGLQGLKSQVKKIEIEPDNVWYRVQVGPFTSRSKMNSAMDKLVSINISPLVKKIKKTKDDA